MVVLYKPKDPDMAPFFKRTQYPQRQRNELASAGTQYSVVATNNSTATWNFYVYQQQPGSPSPGVFSLAWLVLPVAPTTAVTFSWSLDYNFTWSQTGMLKPGVMFNASQIWDADPNGENLVSFGLNGAGAPTFSDEGSGGSAGSLTISQDRTCAANAYSVGIGMSGSGTFVTQSQPGTKAIFTPEPAYWISFGTQVQQGVVLETVVGDSAKVSFPINVYTMYANLGADNSWTVSQAKST